MKRKLNDKRTIFTALMVLGLIFIFFVGRYFNPETAKRISFSPQIEFLILENDWM